MDIEEFRLTVWDYYAHNQRQMPWRLNTDPYCILVSEVMLQQTQVQRVEPKFAEFISAFPTVDDLANATLADVLSKWSGLGYNRRAKFLWQAARAIQFDLQGAFPRSVEELDALPGIGYNTAAAIMNYAYNEPLAYVETNIRTVLLHHFYPNEFDISDTDLLQLADRVLDTENPRQWHWALMDYGTYLKKEYGGRLSQSRHYRKQSPFAGSGREMRGKIIKALVAGPLSDNEMQKMVSADDRYASALAALVNEGIISKAKDKLYLTGQDTTVIIGSNR